MNPDREESTPFRMHNVSPSDTHVSTPASVTRFTNHQILSSPLEGKEEPESAFRIYELDIDDSFEITSPKSPLLTIQRNQMKKAADEPPPATQIPIFKTYNLDEDILVDKAQTLLEETQDFLDASITQPEESPIQIITPAGRCPMCNEPVDPKELSSCGKMNTWMQEKFCRSHRKKTALEEWELKGYPTIKWEKLDSRISKHHQFIKELINGRPSHYRNILNEKVSTGKDRTLMKMTSNLTPGYYGTRGLRVVSENIMKKFTPLLKKRMVQDRLMSARGFTPYVQIAVVPEVVVKLIMEDMNVGVEEARKILEDSVSVGELLNEEIRDVVSRRVVGSDEEDNDDLH